MLGDKKQDSFTKEEVMEIIAKLPKGKYQLDVGNNGDCKLSSVSNRWVQREDVADM